MFLKIKVTCSRPSVVVYLWNCRLSWQRELIYSFFLEMHVHLESQSFAETSRTHYIRYPCFFFTTITLVDTFTGGLHVADGIIRPLFSNSGQTWLIRYIYLFEICHCYIVDNTISLDKGNLIRFWPMLFRPFSFLAAKDLWIICISNLLTEHTWWRLF